MPRENLLDRVSAMDLGDSIEIGNRWIIRYTNSDKGMVNRYRLWDMKNFKYVVHSETPGRIVNHIQLELAET